MEKTIAAERLLLRPFRGSDLPDLSEFLSQLEDDESEGYPGFTPEKGLEQPLLRPGSEEYYAMELKETGKVAGNVCRGLRDYRAGEVGYIANERFRRRGYAAEALSAVVEEVFRSGAHRVYGECDPRNERSWRLLE